MAGISGERALIQRLPLAIQRLAAGPARFRALASTRRFRLQAAGLAALGLILLLALIIPQRNVSITADGESTNVKSRSANDAAVVEDAGIDLKPGDLVQEETDGDLVVRRATEVLLRVDGQTFAMRTQAATVGEVLAEAGVALDEQDSVYRGRAAVSAGDSVAVPPTLSSSAAPGTSTNPVQLDVRRAVPFSVIENSQQLDLRSSRETVADALEEVGVRVGPGDQVQPPLGAELTAGLQVHVQHATRVVVTLPGEKNILYTLEGDVGAALAESSVGLPVDYRLEPAADTPVQAGLAVRVVGISVGQELETVRIESYTLYEPDPSLPPGTTRVVAGQDGVLFRQYAEEYHDDALVSRELAAEWYDPQPIDTIIYYSTAAAVAPVVPRAVPAGGWADLVCSYGWDCDWALAVINCESAGNPNAYNSAGYVGLFQIWQGHGANLTDPATNIAAAYSLYVSGGAGNWPNCP